MKDSPAPMASSLPDQLRAYGDALVDRDAPSPIGIGHAVGMLEDAAHEIERLRAALENVSSVEKQIRLMVYTSAGDPKLMDDMKMYAIWAGTLQKALADAGGVS